MTTTAEREALRIESEGHTERICRSCRGPIPPEKRPTAIYCSRRCNHAKASQVIQEVNPVLGTVPTGTRGAISELRVCADLLEKGYEVFRAVSPAASCDLAALRNGELLRIEVRTGTYKLTGGISYPKNIKADVLAVVLHNQIVYEPPLEAL